ncbi:MAG: DPP IV N-terminal domain-containing protein, partial [Flavobacteriaceae bacterium]|nr:DPP IV N-terminal domain-containing protein [Flavobacteriaceae bacterium]
MRKIVFFIIVVALSSLNANSQNSKKVFSYLDVFDLEYVSDPQISPNGEWVVYRRMGFDIMKDKSKGNLWMIRANGTNHQKLTSREVSESSARWSPTGDRIVFKSNTDEGSEIYLYWVNTGKVAKISQLPFSPSSLIWSPSGNQIAFTMHVPEKPPVAAKMPEKPKGAKWAESPRITDRLKHEADGKGYIKPGHQHIFVISSEGGAARQITSGNYNHRGSLSWSPQGNNIYFSGNRIDDWEYDFRNSEVYSVNVQSGIIKTLTNNIGPDYSPKISSDGKYIAYLGFKDKVQTHQTTYLNIMSADGSNKKVISDKLDRSISSFKWDAKSKGLFVSYDDKGNTKISYINISGKLTKLADNMGGTSIGRP